MENIIRRLKKLENSQNINSSFVRAIDYHKGILYVKLNSRIYKYEYVKKDLYLNFLEAVSKGKFYLRNIKKQYPSYKIF